MPGVHLVYRDIELSFLLDKIKQEWIESIIPVARIDRRDPGIPNQFSDIGI